MFTVFPYDMNCKSWKSILCTLCETHNVSVADNSPPVSTDNMNGKRMTLLINLLTTGHLAPLVYSGTKFQNLFKRISIKICISATILESQYNKNTR